MERVTTVDLSLAVGIQTGQSHQEETHSEEGEGIYAALGSRDISYAGETEISSNITTCPPQAWNYFGPSKTKTKAKHEYDISQTKSESVTEIVTFNDFESKLRVGSLLKHPSTDSDDILHEEISKSVTDSPSANRPTTLEITSSSNDSAENDDHPLTNEPGLVLDQTNDSADKVSAVKIVTVGGTKIERGIGEGLEGAVAVVKCATTDTSAANRLERPPRAAPRTATLVKVKVEKRLVGSHGRSERNQNAHEQGREVSAENKSCSVEAELAGLMAEVKAATSQIKQEVKQMRQSDTPTPDTPTPLREFRDFLNKEEEQELARLPTITELQRETEDDSSNVVASGETVVSDLHRWYIDGCSSTSKVDAHGLSDKPYKIDKSLHCNSVLLDACSQVVANGILVTRTQMGDLPHAHDADDTFDNTYNNFKTEALPKGSSKRKNGSLLNFRKKQGLNIGDKLPAKRNLPHERTILCNDSIARTCSVSSQTVPIFGTKECDVLDARLKTSMSRAMQVIFGLEYLISFIEKNIILGHDLNSLVSSLLLRIEYFETLLSYN